MISTNIPNIMALLRYGKFTSYCPQPHIIEAADAISVEAADTRDWLYPYNGSPEERYSYVIDIPEGFSAIMERFCWGNSDNDGRLYYELYHDVGQVGEFVVNYDDVPGNFHSCGVVTASCDDNRGIHPVTGKRFLFYIYNRSASATYGLLFGVPVNPVNAYIELSVWMYVFRTEYLPLVMGMSADSSPELQAHSKGRL